jgi:hypothetical protein
MRLETWNSVPIDIRTRAGGQGDDIKNWRFDSNGGITFPDDTVQTTAYTGTIVRQDTAPTAANGTLWFNTVEARMYIKYEDQWVDSSPVIIPPPQTDIDVNSITFADASVLTSVADLTPDRLVNGSKEVVLNADGTLALPTSSNGLYTTTNALIKSFADIQISAGDDAGSNWIFGGNGNLLLPSGGTISEGTVTSNPTIQLTPDNPIVASQKLVIKGGGNYQTDDNGISLNLSNITFQVGDAVNAYIYSPANANQTLYWWIVPEGAGIADPDSITLDNQGYGTVTFELDSDDYEFRIRISPEDNNYDPDNIGVESLLINGDAPTFGGDHHLHLTTGDLTETSIILGTDEHNVRTTTDGKIQITTPNDLNNVWEFGADGTLTFPSGNLSIGNAFGSDSILGSTGTIVGVVAQGQYGGVGLQWIDNIENIDSTSTQTLVAAVIVNGPLASTTGTVQIVTGFVNTATTATFAEHTWEFGVDGDLTLPAGGDIKNSSGTSVLSNIQGEYIYEFDGTNTNLTITNVNFNLLFCKVANAYSGSATHTVNLPAGTLGQRLVVINVSTNCTLTISGFSEGIASVTNSSGPAEFIYTSNEGWFPMYGTYTGP